MENDRNGLASEVVRLLRVRKRSESEDVTRINRELAGAFVALREHFLDGDGEPDWRGRTYKYRAFIGELLSDAGYDREESNTTLSSIRYHTGAALRERLDEETLGRLGMLPETPRERSHQRRAERISVVRALTNADQQGGLLVGLTAMLRILSLISESAYSELTAGEREAAEEMIAELRAELTRVARNVRRGSGLL